MQKPFNVFAKQATTMVKSVNLRRAEFFVEIHRNMLLNSVPRKSKVKLTQKNTKLLKEMYIIEKLGKI